MRQVFAVAALSALMLCALPVDANQRKIKVDAPGSGTMEVKITTVDKATTTDTITETVPVTIPNMATAAQKAAAIVAAINGAGGSTRATAAIDPGDATGTTVVITSNADRSVSRIDPRPLKSGERDKLVAAVTPPETAGDAVVVGVNLDGTGNVGGTATVNIGGVDFTITTGSGELFSSVLSRLEAAIDPDPTYEATVVANELRIFGSVLGNDFFAEITDTGPGSLGFSYGFFLESTPIPAPLPSTLVLLAAAMCGGLAMLGRSRVKREPMPALS